jgi:ATP phosphoribosyltransferase regulatory subunit
LLLAKESLHLLSDATVLEVSHLDVVTGLAQAYGLSAEGKKEFFLALADKNEQAVKILAEKEELTQAQTETLTLLTTLYGKAAEVLPLLSRFAVDDKTKAAVGEFSAVLTAVLAAGAENVYVDFSVLNHQNYYNGIAFKGFVKGAPTGVLSGGQYDRLMQKMKKRSKGIGFAVYPDELVKIYAGERK